MKYAIRFCKKCSSYTMKEQCCGEETSIKAPPKFIPDDKYSKYRLRVKKEEWGLNQE